MQTKPRGLARAFGRFLVNLSYEDLPAGVSEGAKSRMLDALSVSFNGSTLPHGQVALRSIRGSKGTCTILGEQTKAAAADAAFVNAVLGHSTLHEDVGGGGHPGTYIIPVALAVGEGRGGAGQDLLTAVITGYEAAARLTQAVPPELMARGFRAVPALGVFGAVAAADKIMRLTEEPMAAALDLAANMAGGLSIKGSAKGPWKATSTPDSQHATASSRPTWLKRGRTPLSSPWRGPTDFSKPSAAPGVTPRRSLVPERASASWTSCASPSRPVPSIRKPCCSRRRWAERISQLVI